ncbi:MAG: hypothetical protein C5B52_09800 [Bacteroidetes bacterium]|nr:MAG: hypothetical protein C5B52_09800 [Bacteroidota bacterium]
MTKFILPLLLLTFTSAFSQNVLVDIHHNKLDYFIKLETQQGAELFPQKSNYVSAEDIAQPIVYRLKQNNLPDLLSYYFFYKKDSSISYILYEWDESNFMDGSQIAKKSYEEIKPYIDKYQLLFDKLSIIYGKPESEGGLGDSIKLATESVSERDVWHVNDSTEIDLQIGLSNKSDRHGAISTKPSFKIRLYIQNNSKEKNNESNISNEKLTSLDKTFHRFLSDIKHQKFESAQTFIADTLQSKITNQQLSALANSIRDTTIEIFISSLRLSQDGKSFYIIQYRYADDNKSAPQQVINVIFDSKNKILGVRSVNRSR